MLARRRRLPAKLEERRLELVSQSCGEGLLTKEEKVELKYLQSRAESHVSCPEVFDEDEDAKITPLPFPKTKGVVVVNAEDIFGDYPIRTCV